MPLVTITIQKTGDKTRKKALLDGVHAALVAHFKIPERDRTQRLLELEPENFDIPPGKSGLFTIVEIQAFAGRSLDAKRALYKGIVEQLEKAGVPPLDVFIVLNDIPRENWGLRGGQAGCDIDFSFTIDV